MPERIDPSHRSDFEVLNAFAPTGTVWWRDAVWDRRDLRNLIYVNKRSLLESLGSEPGSRGRLENSMIDHNVAGVFSQAAQILNQVAGTSFHRNYVSAITLYDDLAWSGYVPKTDEQTRRIYDGMFDSITKRDYVDPTITMSQMAARFRALATYATFMYRAGAVPIEDSDWGRRKSAELRQDGIVLLGSLEIAMGILCNDMESVYGYVYHLLDVPFPQWLYDEEQNFLERGILEPDAL